MKHRIESVTIPGPAGPLEAQFMVPAGTPRAAALFCHPHPLQGGTMHTKAVHRAARALVDAGLPVLRFNFRGVGRSAGVHSGGPGERDDARAALEWLTARHPGVPLVCGGFSFGSWVGLEMGAASPHVAWLLGIGPPLTLYDFSFLERATQPVLLVAGYRDEFCPKDDLEALGRRLGARAEVRILIGADHLLTTRLVALHAAITAFVARQIPAMS